MVYRLYKNDIKELIASKYGVKTSDITLQCGSDYNGEDWIFVNVYKSTPIPTAQDKGEFYDKELEAIFNGRT